MATIPSGTKFLGVDPTFTDLTEKKGIKVDRKSEYFTLEDITAAVGTGSQGAEGPEGPAGPPGPVGPAGLEWQGAWDTDSSYAEDDAVGFNGASWFCISAVTGTGNSNPEEDTEHWALLAAQGAQGIQGIQGPIGPQGPSGIVSALTSGLVSGGTSTPYNVLEYDRNTVTGSSNDIVRLPNNAPIGKVITVSSNNLNPLIIKAYNDGTTISINSSNSSAASYSLYAYDTVKFTSLGSDSWMAEMVLGTNITYNGKRIGASYGYTITDLLVNNTTSALSASTLNTTYPNASYPNGTKVLCPSISGGGLMYIKQNPIAWVSVPITSVV